MDTRSAVSLLFHGALWRGFGSRRAGQQVVQSLSSSDETVRTMAGVLLVKGGSRAVPLIRESLERGDARPMHVRVAADLQAPELLPMIRQYTFAPDKELADVARDAVRMLEEAKSQPKW